MSQIDVFFKRTVVALLWLAGLYVFFRWLLLALLPFLLALGLAAVMEPLVQRVRRRLRVRRSFAAAAVTTLLLTLGGALAALLLRLVVELQSWSSRLPEAVERFPQLWNGMLDQVGSWYAACPAFLRSALDGLARQLMEEGPALAGAAGAALMEAVSALLAALPGIGLFVVTAVLGRWMVPYLHRLLPPAWQSRCRSAAQCCRSTILRWLRAELLLILLTFSILLAGFIWMGLDYALLAAAFTALVDALPVLGVGAVLIPWALLSLLLGGGRSLALLALYAVVTLTHSLVEPKLLAGQADLPPISALLAMYLGFHFMGVGGMILLPVFLLLVKQLQDAGVIRLWK